MWKSLNICGQKGNVSCKSPHPCNPTERFVYFMADVPHIIKCLRNHFLQHRNIQVGSSVASFEYFEKLYEENSRHGINKLVPQLTSAHVKPTNFEKMNVRLATQLFSNTVSNALRFLEQSLPVFKGCGSTAQYTKLINDLFDRLNAKLPKEGILPESCALTEIKAFMDFLEESVESSSRSGRPPFASVQTLESLRVTLNSVVEVIPYLHSLGFKYVLTAKFNQDCLERFFGLIRSAGGNSDHPTVPNFLFLVRLLSIYVPAKVILHGSNVENKEEHVLSWMNDCFQLQERENGKNLSLTAIASKVGLAEEELTNICDHDYSRPDINDCIVYHFGGYVVRKIKKMTKCLKCISTLTVPDKHHESVPKEAALTKCHDRGGLLYCKRELLYLLLDVDHKLKQHMTDKQVHANLFWEIIDDIGPIRTYNIGCELHKSEIVGYIVYFYLFCHMHFYSKQLRTEALRKARRLRKSAKVV